LTLDTLLERLKLKNQVSENQELSEFLEDYVDNLRKMPSPGDTSSMVHWESVALFKYNSVTDDIDVGLQTVDLRLKAKMDQHRSGLSTVQSFKITSTYEDVQYDLNIQVFERLRPQLEETIIDLGTESIKIAGC
jgi:hypothetical protein